MPRFNPLRASLFPFILAALLIATGLTGCAKQRASMALDKARKDLTQAKEIHEAEKYCPDKLKEADEKFKAASNDMSSNQFDSALINGKIAAELSRQLLTTTKQLRAGALVAEADKHVKVIEANHAESIDKVKYDKIHQLKEDAVQANGKDKHDKAIELGLAVKTETDALLNQLKTDMESKLADVKKVKLEELLREEGRKEAQAFVTKAESDIVEMEKMISYEQREYVKAGNLHTAIVKGIADGIIEARKNRSVKKLAILEEKLVRARFEGAEQYHAQRLAECESTYTNINKHFQSADYVFVLTNADIFDPQLDRLILETRTLCAKDKMQNVVNAIAAMEADQVRKYLPDRLEKVEKMLASAQGEFKNDLFDEVKKICAAAMEEKELIIKDFDALAVEEIRKGRTDMDSSSDLLGKMGNIFAIHSPISQDPQRTNFENGKRALQGELDRIVKDSALLIGVAEVQREGKKMSAAIEASRKVVRDARYVTYQIYHVIVHNNLLEISDRMTRIAGDGGSQFAQAELDKATKVLQEAQEMVREREKETATLKRDDVKDPDAFKLAIAKTSDAFTEMEVVVQRVKHVVADKIDEARKSVGAAEKCKTELFAQDDMANVKQMVQQSEALLAKGELYNSACKADEVKTSALNAAVKSAGLYADRELDGARIAVKKATDAGTEQYAPVRLKDAQQRLKTSEDLYNGVKTSVDKVKASESLLEAADLAAKSAQAADAARLEPVTTAQDAITTAKRFDAWKYDYSTLLQALMHARTAMEAVQANDYDRARLYSELSIRFAQASTVYAKNAAFADRVKNANEELKTASENGGAFFNADAVRKLAERLQNIKVGYSVEQFETISAELNTCEADLKKIVLSTPAVFEDTEKRCQAKYDELSKAFLKDVLPEEMQEASRTLRSARANYDRKDFNRAYLDMCKAIRTLNYADSRFKEQAFIDQINDLFSKLTESKEVSVKTLLQFTPSSALATYRDRSRIGGRLSIHGSDTNKFRADMDQLYLQARGIEVPVTLKNTGDKLVECFRLAREASIQFEKFSILDRYDHETSSQIIEQAYALISHSKEIQQELQKQFEAKGLQGRLSRFESKATKYSN